MGDRGRDADRRRFERVRTAGTATAFLVAALVVAAGVAPALAQQEGTVVGRPNLDLSATDNRVGAGERVTLDVFVSNDGDIDRGGPAEYEQRVTTARNVRLEIDEDRMNRTLRRGIEVRTGEVFAGSVPEGASGPYGFSLDVSESLSPGTYEIPVEMTYDYTNFVRYGPNAQPEYGDGTRTQTGFVTVVVEDSPEFSVAAENLTPVTAGDATTYRLNVTNTGTQPATDVRVGLSAANSSLFFGGADAPQQRTSVFFERMEPGESRTFGVTVGAAETTAPGTYLADAVVSYEDPSGVSGRSAGLSFGVAVGSEQTFALRSVDADLAVGDAGNVTGRVVNTGESNVTDAVVLFGGGNGTLSPRETEYAVGDLAPGESADFSFGVDARDLLGLAAFGDSVVDHGDARRGGRRLGVEVLAQQPGERGVVLGGLADCGRDSGRTRALDRPALGFGGGRVGVERGRDDVRRPGHALDSQVGPAFESLLEGEHPDQRGLRDDVLAGVEELGRGGAGRERRPELPVDCVERVLLGHVLGELLGARLGRDLRRSRREDGGEQEAREDDPPRPVHDSLVEPVDGPLVVELQRPPPVAVVPRRG